MINNVLVCIVLFVSCGPYQIGAAPSSNASSGADSSKYVEKTIIQTNRTDASSETLETLRIPDASSKPDVELTPQTVNITGKSNEISKNQVVPTIEQEEKKIFEEQQRNVSKSEAEVHKSNSSITNENITTSIDDVVEGAPNVSNETKNEDIKRIPIVRTTSSKSSGSNQTKSNQTMPIKESRIIYVRRELPEIKIPHLISSAVVEDTLGSEKVELTNDKKMANDSKVSNDGEETSVLNKLPMNVTQYGINPKINDDSKTMVSVALNQTSEIASSDVGDSVPNGELNNKMDSATKKNISDTELDLKSAERRHNLEVSINPDEKILKEAVHKSESMDTEKPLDLKTQPEIPALQRSQVSIDQDLNMNPIFSGVSQDKAGETQLYDLRQFSDDDKFNEVLTQENFTPRNIIERFYINEHPGNIGIPPGVDSKNVTRFDNQKIPYDGSRLMNYAQEMYIPASKGSILYTQYNIKPYSSNSPDSKIENYPYVYASGMNNADKPIIENQEILNTETRLMNDPQNVYGILSRGELFPQHKIENPHSMPASDIKNDLFLYTSRINDADAPRYDEQQMRYDQARFMNDPQEMSVPVTRMQVYPQHDKNHYQFMSDSKSRSSLVPQQTYRRNTYERMRALHPTFLQGSKQDIPRDYTKEYEVLLRENIKKLRNLILLKNGEDLDKNRSWKGYRKTEDDRKDMAGEVVRGTPWGLVRSAGFQ